MDSNARNYSKAQLLIVAAQNELLAEIEFPGTIPTLSGSVRDWAKKFESSEVHSPVLELHRTMVSKLRNDEPVTSELFSLGLMSILKDHQPVHDSTGASGQFYFAWESFTLCGVKRREEARLVASTLLDMVNVASHYPKAVGLTEIKYRVFVKRAKFLTVQPDRWIKLIERARASGKIYS